MVERTTSPIPMAITQRLTHRQKKNDVKAENQAAVDIPSWMFDRWEGYRRLLEINPDGSGKLVADPATRVGTTKETLQLIDSPGTMEKGHNCEGG